MMICSGLTYVGGVMFTMHSARNWMFSWGGWAYIVAVTATQIVGIAFMDLTTTRNVIIFSMLSALATFLVQVAWAVVGFTTRLAVLSPPSPTAHL